MWVKLISPIYRVGKYCILSIKKRKKVERNSEEPGFNFHVFLL